MTTQSIVLAGGCFWGVQAVFQHVRGVTQVISGYAGGAADTANYDAVCSGTTGHAEAVKVTYDPDQINLNELLGVYFHVAHDPTYVDAQGPDVGTQYRSHIFYTTDEQARAARAYIDQLNADAVFKKPIATKISPLDVFYAAENYHQDYAAKHPDNPYIACHDLPKLDVLRSKMADLYVTKHA